MALVSHAFALGIFVSSPGQAATGAADPSDLWWNPAEPGWGMQLVQGGEVLFATLYVYDAAGSATFYSATLARSAGAWSGALYETRGPYFALPSFVPDQVQAASVGSLEFTQPSASDAQLRYDVRGVVVTKAIRRQLLRVDDYSGRYTAVSHSVATHCSDSSANAESTTAGQLLTIVHSGTALAVEWNAGGRSCRYTGEYSQAGRLGSAATTYACSDGEEGSMAFFDLTRRNGFISARFQGHGISNGCDRSGELTALQPF